MIRAVDQYTTTVLLHIPTEYKYIDIDNILVTSVHAILNYVLIMYGILTYI